MSSNLSDFVYNLVPWINIFCPLFKKQRRRFPPVKLCTVKVNISDRLESNSVCNHMSD